MNITAAAIRNDRVTALAILVVVLGGVVAFLSLPRAEDPGFTVRTALVTTHFPGASPPRVELLVTDKIEKRVEEMPELDFVSSISRNGTSIIFATIKQSYTEMRPIWDDLRRKVEASRGDLPEGVVGPFVNDDFGDVYPIMLTLTSDGFTYAELDAFAEEIRDDILRIDDVAKVDVYGKQEERVFVEYRNARLAELGISPVQLRSLLEARNIIIPGGTITAGAERISLEPSGNFETIEDLRRTIVQAPGRPGLIYLEDIAEVTRGYVDPPTAIMRDTGRQCLGLSISMREGGDVIDMGEKVSARVRDLEARYPIGLDFDLVIFQPALVDEKVRDFVGSLLQAIGIVLAVMLISLGLRTGFVVAALIPVTMLTTLFVMQRLGIGLDQISIAALIIALGMLVDNAIVMSESIMVQISEGKDRFRAAVDSANELRVPLLSASLTTSAAFLPIFLAESSTGEYTASLFKVVTIALLVSWLLSLTMMPLLCMLFIKVKPSSESYDTRFYHAYRKVLVAGLRHRFTSIGAVVAIFGLAILGLGLVPNVFFPRSDTPRMTGELDMPLGTPIEETDRIVAEIETFMRDSLRTGGRREDGLTTWSTYVGAGGGPRYRLSYDPAQAGAEHASLIVGATSREAIEEAIPRLERFCLVRFPALKSQWWPEQLGPPVEAPVQIRLSGEEIDALFAIVEDTKARLSTLAGTKTIDDDWGARTKKLLVLVDQPRARRAGVTSQDIAISLQTVLSGIVTTEYREGSDVIPVTLRSVAADRQDIGKLEGLNVFAQASGRSVPLKQVADIRVAWEPSQILRRDRSRTVTVSCDVTAGVTALDVVNQVRPWLDAAAAEWPLGYRYELGGEIESSVEANQAIGEQLPIALFIILLLMVIQFNSIRKTMIVLLTIPLGMIGVTIGLLVTGAAMGFMTFLGVISLAGIIINNAIVLLDRIRIEIEENGLAPAQAILESAQRRLRPILLTTCTTVGGLLPLWLGGGPMWRPMAVAIIFGLIFATVLTLGVVPILYSLFYRVRVTGHVEPAPRGTASP